MNGSESVEKVNSNSSNLNSHENREEENELAEEEFPNEKRKKLVQFTSNKKITKRALDPCEASSEGSNMKGPPVKIMASRRDPVPDKTVTPVGYVKVLSENSIPVDIC